jgi:hypothetical protein
MLQPRVLVHSAGLLFGCGKVSLALPLLNTLLQKIHLTKLQRPLITEKIMDVFAKLALGLVLKSLALGLVLKSLALGLVLESLYRPWLGQWNGGADGWILENHRDAPVADLQQMLHTDGGLAVQAAGGSSRQIVLLSSRVLKSVKFLQAILGSKEE